MKNFETGRLGYRPGTVSEEKLYLRRKIFLGVASTALAAIGYTRAGETPKVDPEKNIIREKDRVDNEPEFDKHFLDAIEQIGFGKVCVDSKNFLEKLFKDECEIDVQVEIGAKLNRKERSVIFAVKHVSFPEKEVDLFKVTLQLRRGYSQDEARSEAEKTLEHVKNGIKAALRFYYSDNCPEGTGRIA